MHIAVRCPDCDKTYHVKPELAGKRGKCPQGHTLLVPAGEGPAEPEGEPADPVEVVAPSRALAGGAPGPAEEVRTCPSCGAELEADAAACPDCGPDPRAGRKPGPARRKRKPRAS